MSKLGMPIAADYAVHSIEAVEFRIMTNCYKTIVAVQLPDADVDFAAVAAVRISVANGYYRPEVDLSEGLLSAGLS